MTKPPKPLVLIILDGWGVNARTRGNAISQANPPFYQSLLENYPNTTLAASGESVGLPDGQMGNSEVGHINIGAGRIVHQGLTRISKAISDGSFFLNPNLNACLKAVKSAKGTFHLLGLLSDGGVHSHIDHLDAILDLSQKEGIQRLRVHPFLDGRDTPPRSGLGTLRTLEEMLKKKQPTGADWKIATVTGRFFAMDRDQRWERIESAYHALVSGKGVAASSAHSAVQKSYDDGTGDEFLKPVIIFENGHPVGTIQDDDGIFFFNFRADRARQLTHAFVDNAFDFFKRKDCPALSSFVSMTSYEEALDYPVAFAPVQLNQVLGEVLSQRGLRQLRIAETEKYAHVTYFLNGGREKVFEKEERILVPSPRDVETYDQKPEMSAFEVCDEVIRQVKRNRFDFICINFANPDMVGHSGILGAAVKAVMAVDQSLKKTVNAILEAGGAVIITADHGNLEQMVDYETGEPHTAHTTNPVPFILCADENYKLKPGIHANIAPTILDLMQIPKPSEMDQDSLILDPG